MCTHFLVLLIAILVDLHCHRVKAHFWPQARMMDLREYGQKMVSKLHLLVQDSFDPIPVPLPSLPCVKLMSEMFILVSVK